MDIYRNFFLCFVLTIFLTSCKQNLHISTIKVSLLERKPHNISNGTINISNVTEIMVPDSFALSRFDKWLWINNDILVADFSLTKAIYCFSKDGVFKYYIPFGIGEEFSDFCLVEDSLLMVSDSRNGRLIKYDRKTGVRLNVIDLRNGALISNIFYIGYDKYLIFNNYGTGNWGNYKLFQINASQPKSQLTDKWFGFKASQTKDVHMKQFNNFFRQSGSNKINFHEFGSNTIFEVTDNSIEPVAQFSLFPQKDNFDTDTSSYHDIYESISEKKIAVPEDYVVASKNFIYFQYFLNDSSYQVLYDNRLNKAIFNCAFIVDTALKIEIPAKWLPTEESNLWISLGWQKNERKWNLVLYTFKIR